MIEKLIAAIQDWPVIVQSIIGAAIFWLILMLGQKITVFVSAKAREHSQEKQKKYLFNEILRHKAVRSGNDHAKGTFYSSVLWYRASRDVIRGLIWLTLGLIFNSISYVFGLVGFLGCLYCLFAALNIVKPFEVEGDVDTKIAALVAEREKLKTTP